MVAKKKVSSVHLSWPKPHFTHTVKTDKHFMRNFHGAMLYAHYELSSSELKKEVVKYLKSQDPKHPLLDRIKDMDENRFSTIGKYMYILNHKADVPDPIFVKLIPALETTIEQDEKKRAAIEKARLRTEELESDNVVRFMPSIQDRILDRTREVAGDIEGWIDDFCLNKQSQPKSVEEFVNLFKANDLKAPHMRHMTNIFQRRAAQVAEVVEGKNKELNEGYSNFTRPEIKKLDIFHQNLLKACAMLQEVAKVTRAPMKRKPVSQDKLVARLKYKKEDSTLGIVSINPIQLLGAKEAWIYDTQKRKLSQYKAKDIDGLSVKGMTLINYSSDSVEKTLRKPVEALADFKKASKVKLRTFMSELTTIGIPCRGRLNDQCIILRIDK
ncbi:MAG TPA: hypothetical protein VIY47_15615 [Ignavibacteriaceae bacterium]